MQRASIKTTLKCNALRELAREKTYVLLQYPKIESIIIGVYLCLWGQDSIPPRQSLDRWASVVKSQLILVHSSGLCCREVQLLVQPCTHRQVEYIKHRLLERDGYRSNCHIPTTIQYITILFKR